MPMIRQLLIMEMDAEKAETAAEELSGRLDDFRETVAPAREYGLTIYEATARDLEHFPGAGCLLPEPQHLLTGADQ